ncbi:MAG: DUF1566 domain-containing protein, partial [bacterium]|nr:DUF1566 domain-containing protein [bacterium]
TIKKVLSQDGPSTLFLATSEKFRQELAIEIVGAGAFPNDTFPPGFKENLEAISALTHPNIVKLHEVGQGEDGYYLVSDYHPETLASRLCAGSPYRNKPADALPLIKQLAVALHHAASKGIEYSVIHPGNIFFSDGLTPQIKLVDFSAGHKQSFYKSPEHIEGAVPDIRSSFYGLGIILYEMLTDSVPFDAAHHLEIERKHLAGPVPPLQTEEAVGRMLQPVMDKLTAREGSRRFRDVEELSHTLDKMTGLLMSAASTELNFAGMDKAVVANRRKGVVAGMAIILVAMVVALGFFLHQTGQNRIKTVKAREDAAEKIQLEKEQLEAREESKKKEFKESVNMAMELFQQEEFYEALRKLKAAKLIKESTDIEGLDSTGIDIDDLEKKINERISLTSEQEFTDYVRQASDLFARGNYEEAHRVIYLAKAIKVNSEVVNLEMNIKRALNRQERENARAEQRDRKKPKMAAPEVKFKDDDERDYRRAVFINSISSYKVYLKKHSKGRYAAEVKQKMALLERERKDFYKDPSVKKSYVRGKFIRLTKADVKAMIKKRKFHDKYMNPGGGYRNTYKIVLIGKIKVVVDHAADLMWHKEGTSNTMPLGEAKVWLKRLNKNSYGGFNDWRLPTLEEALTLLESSKIHSNLFIDKIFSNKQKYIWTGDSNKTGLSWVVDFADGAVRLPVLYNTGLYIRPVRSFR